MQSPALMSKALASPLLLAALLSSGCEIFRAGCTSSERSRSSARRSSRGPRPRSDTPPERLSADAPGRWRIRAGGGDRRTGRYEVDLPPERACIVTFRLESSHTNARESDDRGRICDSVPHHEESHGFPVRLRRRGGSRGSRRPAARGRHARDHGHGQHVHRSGRLDDGGPRSGDDPLAARGRLRDRARGRRRRGRGRGGRGGLGRVQAGREVAAQGHERGARSRRLVEAEGIRLSDVAEREAERLRGGAVRRWALDGRDLRHGRRRRRKARRPGRADLQPAAAEGLLARDLRRQDGAQARRGPAGRARQVRPGRNEGARHSRRRRRDRPGRQGRLRRRLRRPRARQAGARRRRHALHDRLQHEGADDAAPRQARRGREADVGHARHEGAADLQARQRRDDARGQDPAAHLRLHRAAASGPRVALPVPGRHARGRDGHPRHDAADERSSASCSSTRT